MSDNTARKTDLLGRLKSFGLSESWQVALLLPTGWDDFRQPLRRFDASDLQEGQTRLVVGRLVGTPEPRFDGTPRLVGKLADERGQRVSFVQFGDTRQLQAALREAESEELALLGTLSYFQDRLCLRGAELVALNWLHRLRPRYPSKPNVVTTQLVRGRVLGFLKEAIPVAAQWLADTLADFGSPGQLAGLAGGQGWTLERLLYLAHLPDTPEIGAEAQRGLERLAALGILREARAAEGIARPSRLPLKSLRPRIEAIEKKSFPLTDDQKRAVAEIWYDLREQAPMRRLLSGDVGRGKTAVIALACAAAVDAGGLAAVILPNDTLAAQVAREIGHWWPELSLQLVTGQTTEEPAAPLLVGTTAILHRVEVCPDLLVVDEQQKFSREQREALVGAGTHLLEVTATCIPRTQALLRYGVLKVSRLVTDPVKKIVRTQIWQTDGKDALFAAVQRTIVNKGQVLVVYPLREPGPGDCGAPQEGPPPLPSAEEAFALWDRAFPGRVRLIHAEKDAAEKEAALTALRQGEADVLVATSIVEVGLTLPALRRVVVVHPERYGLSQLHQIRGRVARTGGEGFCDLYLPRPVKEPAMERLQVLARTNDGFEVSEHDMRLRGVGDLSRGSSRQSGADATFLFGRGVGVDVLDEMIRRLDEMTGHH